MTMTSGRSRAPSVRPTGDMSLAPRGVARLVGTSNGQSWAEHQRALGPLPTMSVEQLVDLVTESGLTGRGGAGFPTARKIAAVVAAGSAPVVVGNAMEGEFLSHKDAYLVGRAPHLLLDGLQVLGDTLGARRQVLAVGHGKDSTAVRDAVRSRGRSRGRLEVRDLEGGFISGQESALVNQLNGLRGVPGDPLTPVYRKGVSGRPTLVANAETLAQLGLLARFGSAWFRSQGTPEDPGTFLATVTGSSSYVVPRPGVREVARGTRLRDVLSSAGTPLDDVQAVLVGGYHGTWLPGEALDAPLSREGLAPYGATPGAGVLHVLDRQTCPLRTSAEIATYLAGETAGQCGPCLNGLPRMADTLTRLAGRRADPRLVHEVDRLRDLVTGRGACAHPDGTARLVASTMRVFSMHVDSHLRGFCHARGEFDA
jgi:NADH:ubiquinone oxidoreductase subunit F (NADH-binding)